MSVFSRNNVHVQGTGRPMMFVHGFGCDQNMWRLLAPYFAGRYQLILLDLVGSGNSDLSAFDPEKYSTLQGYADDVCEILKEVTTEPAVFVGHSVSAMIGLLANVKCPKQFDSQIMVGPSPCYINDGDYFGGFERKDIEELLETLESNYLGWSSNMAPVIMGAPGQPELATELTNSFCRTDPDIAKPFARVTFMSDHRADLPRLQAPTLILQCSDDVIAPTVVGEYVHNEISGSVFVQLDATGHCPNLSAPRETIDAIRAFL